MALKVPGNPFDVSVQVGSTQGVGMYEAPETPYSQKNALAGLEQKTGEFGKQLEAWQAEIDETRVKDWANQLEKTRMDLRDNPETGYKTLKGDNALDPEDGVSLLDKYGGKLDASYQELRKKASNPRQKAALDNFYRDLKFRNDTEMQTYLVGEFESKRAAVEQDTLRLASTKAVSSDEREAAEGEYAMRNALDAMEKRMGVPIDRQKYLSPIHTARLNKLIDDDLDYAAAKAYLERNRSELTPAAIKTTEAALLELKNADDGRAAATSILSKYRDSKSKALAAVYALPADIRKNAETLVSKYFTIVESAEKERKRELTRAIWSAVYGGHDPDPSMMAELRQIDPKGANAVDSARLKAAKGETVSIDDAETLNRLTQLQEDDPVAFAELEMTQFVGTLTNGTINSLIKAQAKVGDQTRKDFIAEAVTEAKARGVKTADLSKFKIAAGNVYDDLSANGPLDKTAREGAIRTLFIGRRDSWFSFGKAPLWKEVGGESGMTISDATKNGWVVSVDDDELIKVGVRAGIGLTEDGIGNMTPEKRQILTSVYTGRPYPNDLWEKARKQTLKYAEDRGIRPSAVTNAHIQRTLIHMYFD